MLALHSDGSVYHLRLLAHELADKIIFVGDPDRVALVSAHFSSIELKRQYREFVTHTGMCQGQRLSVISTGIGVSNIDIVMNEIDALKNIDLVEHRPKDELTSLQILRVGTCGGLDATLAPDSYVVSSSALGFDANAHFYQRTASIHDRAMLARLETIFAPLGRRQDLYVAHADDVLCSGFSDFGHLGITVTCPGFYAAQGRELRVPIVTPSMLDCVTQQADPDYPIMNVEMETAMIYTLGALMGHRCCSLSSVVFNRITQAASADAFKAVNHLIARALERLLSL